jgi:hypothetical protein
MSRDLTPVEKAQIEREVATDERIRALEAKTALREEAERPDQVSASDRQGLPDHPIVIEESVWKRFSPFRNRWPEVAQYDQRAGELELREQEIRAELQAARDREQQAPVEHADALARWELGGRKTRRPEPELPAIVCRIEELEAELEGVRRAVAKTLDEKAAFVARHRPRLRKQAHEATDQAAERYLQLIEQLAPAREELRACRRTEVWSELYPRQEAMQEPPDSVAGGRRRSLEQAGISQAIDPNRLIDVLRADVEWLRGAATVEQAAAIEGRDPRQRPDTYWKGSPEWQAWQKREAQQARQRQAWGGT